jgi:diketogulonate reductase-like aldo/keto reductase
MTEDIAERCSDGRGRNRRRLLAALAAAALSPRSSHAAAEPVLRRPIRAGGETLPAVGMGTWITFDAGDDPRARAALLPVLQAFFDQGGALIDSSPMYGSAEAVLGDLLPRTRRSGPLFAATKVWIAGRWLGERQMERSLALWGLPRVELMQIHNMLDWETHLATLRRWKAEGRIRYIGITTSHGRRHEALERAMTREDFDFVQFTYNITHREAERRLLPLAAERGMAVIANRPFDGGDLFAAVRGKPLPSFAVEIGCENWAQFFLKFILAHPVLTCAIPATSKVGHMLENMGALRGPLPDDALRRRMVGYFEGL